MNARIAKALINLFDQHRILFWYDSKQELRQDFEQLQLPGVTKVELENNEFGLKYRLLREEPKQKFLLYREGPQPPDLENWLLDVQLANGEFRTDQTAIWLSELGLTVEFSDVVEAHSEFFQAKKRRRALKDLLEPDDIARQIRMKMLASCAGSEPRIDAILENLLQELADERSEKLRLIERCNLDEFLWEQMQRHYGYDSEEPGVRDFVIELFKSCYAMGIADGEVKLTGDALVFLKRWKDSRQFEESFEILSYECAEVLGIEEDLANRELDELIELDYFELIDQKILSELVRAVVDQIVSSDEISHLIWQRRQSHWYSKYRHIYEAIDQAARFKEKLSVLSDQWSEISTINWTLNAWTQRYSESWYELDQLYRRYTYHTRKSGLATLTNALTEQVENLYSNNYLLRVNDRFQVFVDSAPSWDAYPIPRQDKFFAKYVQPFLERNHKVCVIISDAMRYEAGEELLSRIRQEDRYSAEIVPALSMLPSYTQLGMAALLPNKEIKLAAEQKDTVYIDGLSSRGTRNRENILRRGTTGEAAALTAEELMAMHRDESRALMRDHDVVYIYHNRIDATGDKLSTEAQVFEAVEETFQELIKLIKKLTNANANNLLITADHGFIYQDRPIDESDFSDTQIHGAQVLYQDRRFVLGLGLTESPSMRKFMPDELGLLGDVEIQIPKSINRLRLKGSGSRYVHGGAALQEVVIPILKINKKRESDVTTVDIDIQRTGTTMITASQLTVSIYQVSPVTDKIQPRSLRAGIYTQAGTLISDCQELYFDLTSENPRDRELRVTFTLTQEADDANGQEVILRLDEQHAGTSHFKEYRSLRYMMRRSFTSDFDL